MKVVLVFPSASARRPAIAKAIKKSGVTKVASDGRCLVCKTGSSRTAVKLAGISGIGDVATAEQVPRRFSDVTKAIVQTGSEAILPGEKFYVKVIMTIKADYVERDVEFASAGSLVEKLSEINALPARNEQQADRVILVIVGKRSAYVCVKGKI